MSPISSDNGLQILYKSMVSRHVEHNSLNPILSVHHGLLGNIECLQLGHGLLDVDLEEDPLLRVYLEEGVKVLMWTIDDLL